MSYFLFVNNNHNEYLDDKLYKLIESNKDTCILLLSDPTNVTERFYAKIDNLDCCDELYNFNEYFLVHKCLDTTFSELEIQERTVVFSNDYKPEFIVFKLIRFDSLWQIDGFYFSLNSGRIIDCYKRKN